MTGMPKLSDAQVAELAVGGATAGTVAVLRAGQAVKTTLRLHRLLTSIDERHPGSRLAALARHQFDALADVQRSAPETVLELLTHPHVGAWAARCLRRVRQGAPADDELTAEVGHLAAVAGAAAIRAGQELTIPVPSRHGCVALPSLGVARVADAPDRGWATLVCAAGEGEVAGGGTPVALPADPRADGPGWTPIRVLRSEGPVPLEVHLDDLDPFRDCGHLPVAARLRAEEAERFAVAFDEGWRLLCRDHPRYAPGLAAGLRSLVPMRDDPRRRSSAVTSMDAFGAVALTTPRDAPGLALTLVHEFQHGKLGALLDLLPLYEPDDRPRYFAPWRDDPRPFGALLQGIYAHLGVTDFWRVRRHRDDDPAALAHVEFAHWRDQTIEATATARADGPLTEAGGRFLALLDGELRRWASEPVPPAPLRLAEAATTDRRIGWRLLWQPAPDDVDPLARSWVAGEAAPPAAGAVRISLPPRAATHRSNPRLTLLYLLLAEPGRTERLGDDPQRLAREVPGANPADLCYLLDRHETAVTEYLRQIAADGGTDSAWSGLALAYREQAPATEASEMLMQHPELVRAVHRRVDELSGHRPDPVTLAAWLRPVRTTSG
ncbi:HEXXH motif domain-containing protein [Plantactinospora sp. WMMB334]|uniref:HEXXH motif domain-containing protein n=1 Tax=Plantactinospora sp. WMMB334 TaxID=3404119 RepID=UPI003B92FF34